MEKKIKGYSDKEKKRSHSKFSWYFIKDFKKFPCLKISVWYLQEKKCLFLSKKQQVPGNRTSHTSKRKVNMLWGGRKKKTHCHQQQQQRDIREVKGCLEDRRASLVLQNSNRKNNSSLSTWSVSSTKLRIMNSSRSLNHVLGKREMPPHFYANILVLKFSLSLACLQKFGLSVLFFHRSLLININCKTSLIRALS